ncbi:hypothetical protein DXG01_002013, partial [Tephrocybe rancida]
KAQKVSIKSDPERINFNHLGGSRTPGHNDWGITNLLNDPDSHQGPEIVDGHSSESCTPKEGNRKDESTSVAPMKPMSHKQIKLEIKKLKQLAKIEESKGQHHDGRCERCSVEPMLFEMANMVSHASKEVPKKDSKNRGRSVSVKASEQLNPKSFLGKAFKDLSESESDSNSDHGHKSDNSGSDLSDSSYSDNGCGLSDDSPSSSSNEDNSSSGDDSSDDGSSDDGHDCKRKKSQKKSKAKAKAKKARARSKKCAKSKHSMLKPTPPDKYNGCADPVKYVRFINQCNLYLKRGKVPAKDEITEISNFLTDKAYDYYLSDVSMELRKWKLPRFFKALFNACFPADFHILQQDKLDEFSQGSLPAWEYATQLKNLFCIVGYTSKHEKARCLWKGFIPHLRQKMFESGLDPEKSKWGVIVDHTEMFEIACNMGLDNKSKSQRDTKGQKNNNQQGSSSNNPGGNNCPTRNSDTSSSNCNRSNQNKGHGNQGRYNGNKNSNNHRPNSSYKSKPNGGSNININKLSTEELKKYRDEGLCYRCGESGHIGCNCDKSQNMKGNKLGPPGVRSNNIEYLNETEHHPL